MTYRILIFSFIFLLLTPLKNILASELNVVSSIKPIQLISTAIVGDLGQSNVLLPPSANPHNYQLRPSQMRLLNDADLFVWVGPELELFLVKVLKSNSVKQIPLIQTLELKSEEDDEHHEQSSSEQDYHAHEHSHEGGFDPHIWLDPTLASLIAESIYQQLAAQFPEKKAPLKQNLDTFKKQLSIVEAEISNELNVKTTIDIYTFHQAFSHFAEHFGLKISGTITSTPEARPGARHLSRLRDELQKKQEICLIKEPNFKAPYVESIAKGVDVTTVTADPLATDIENSEAGYFNFLQSIAHSFTQCQN